MPPRGVDVVEGPQDCHSTVQVSLCSGFVVVVEAQLWGSCNNNFMILGMRARAFPMGSP